MTALADKLLSKGEKKRLSIAVELITNPALIFMDEPTTSMDTFTAEKIVEIINKLKSKGHTIIATIHQPNTQIFRSFDQLMLLSFGHVIYFGDANKSVDYFKSIGRPCPETKNPAEYFMQMMTKEPEQINFFVQKFNETPMSSKFYL
jgi:ATP-binding cassette subfamily G (WHITE) protein 1